jgi:hypothetical protein
MWSVGIAHPTGSEIDFPVEAVIEMALAGYLDSEAIEFVDYKPNRYHN